MDPWNVRLALSSDGFKLFKHVASYNIWTVSLVVHNLSQWMSMNQPYFFMPMLIPDHKSLSGNGIDVYSTLLINGLNELWINGVNICDAHTDTTL